MEEQTRVRQEKLEKLKRLGVEPYPYRYDTSATVRQIVDEHGESSAEELENLQPEFRIAGRIVALRDMGKSSFIHLFDGEEKLQVYFRKDVIGEKGYEVFKLFDIGDLIGINGKLFRTRTGELTLLASEALFLAKSFHPLPEKWHGLQDKELRFRQRYLDLIVNENSRRVFEIRSAVIQTIRRFFHQRGYREVETPMMQPIPGGAVARPFETHHNALDIDLYLRIAPELYLKRLLVAGMEKVFEINRNFRNEGISQMHNPEFTMLEFYQLYRDFEYFMKLSEELIAEIASSVLDDPVISWRGKKISLAAPFKRQKYMDILSRRSGIAPEELWKESAVRQAVLTETGEDACPPTYGKQLEFLFDHHVEATLMDPVFITHYPKVISPLSKVARDDDRLTERFELFIAGMEIANGFSELNDPVDQRMRFEAQQKNQEKGDDEAHVVDQDFLTALEYGMPPAAGEGIGIDRLVMLFCDAPSIKEVILFPLLRPKE